jgi:glycosyltransferase involved in cell wall biosynthesis
MISVVIATLNDAAALGRTLAALVPAAVDGLVREVVLADGGSDDLTLEIADDAGARVVACAGATEARLVEGCAAARSDWLLILGVDEALPAGWAEAAAAHVNGPGPAIAAWWGGKPRLLRRPEAPALLISRRLYDEAGGYVQGLAGRLGRRAVRLAVD